MSVIRPQAIFELLKQHWPFVRVLTLAAQESPMFDMADLERVAAREMADRTLVERRSIIAEMQRKGLLQEFPRTLDLQLHPAVQTFAEALMHEHQLAPVGVVRANIEAIKEATDKINKAVQTGQFIPSVKEGAMALQMLCRSIRNQVDHDHQAILNIADDAKAADANLPLEQRYQRVLESFDLYVDPMVSLILPGQSGEFDRYIRAAEVALVAAEQAIGRTGGLISLRRDVHNVALMVTDLPAHTRQRMMHAVAVLRPMREQVRKHSAMSVAVTRVLAAVRKRGIREALPLDLLPDFCRTKPSVVHLGLATQALLAEFKAYEPAPTAFPDLAALEDVLQVDPTTYEKISRRLASMLPGEVPDLLAWLRAEFPHLGDQRTLGTYHRLVATVGERAVAREGRSVLALDTVDVEYHPHQIELAVAAKDAP